MTYTLELTGIAAQISGTRTLQLQLSGEASLLEIEQELVKKIPALGRYDLKFSVNGRLHPKETVPNEKDELLIFSPYSGG